MVAACIVSKCVIQVAYPDRSADTFRDKAFQSDDHNTGGDHTCPVLTFQTDLSTAGWNKFHISCFKTEPGKMGQTLKNPDHLILIFVLIPWYRKHKTRPLPFTGVGLLDLIDSWSPILVSSLRKVSQITAPVRTYSSLIRSSEKQYREGP